MKQHLITALILFCGLQLRASDIPSDSIRIQKLETKVIELSDYKEKMQYAYGVCAGLFTAFGLIIYFLDESYKKKLENKVNEFEGTVTTRFAKVVNDNESLVNSMLDKANIEKHLFDTKKILIWGESDSSFIESSLKKMRFNHVNLTKDEKSQFDVIFINNLNGGLLDVDMIKIANKYLADEKVCLFYYNSTRKNFPNDKLSESMQDRINFATNAAQIYGNLLNTLKYQDKISKL